MSTIKNDILALIPASEKALRDDIDTSTGTKAALSGTLLSAFGFNKPQWKTWQKEIETLVENTPDNKFAVSESSLKNSIKQWLTKSVGESFDTDGHYGLQCKDFANAYAQWLGYPLQPSNAGETWDVEQDSYWKKVSYQPGMIPQLGDIVIWGGWPENIFGHIAVILEASTNTFQSVDQNWNSTDVTKGSPAAIIEHSYTKPKIIGFLRPTL